MTILHPEQYIFPHPSLADDEGLLAIGGDLTTARLICAYSSGIFPWYSEGQPILWWSPDPRCIIYPSDIHISKSMRSYFKQNKYQITIDQAFANVINHCKKTTRIGQDGTWITEEMQAAYIRLHEEGIAHSVEVWEKDQLVGGLYGVSVGKIFSGESMFSLKSNASKFALITLAKILQKLGFHCIDCQMETEHLMRMGAINIKREEFFCLLKENALEQSMRGSWSCLIDTFEIQS